MRSSFVAAAAIATLINCIKAHVRPGMLRAGVASHYYDRHKQRKPLLTTSERESVHMTDVDQEPHESTAESMQSISCVLPTVTVTVDAAVTEMVTTTIVAGSILMETPNFANTSVPGLPLRSSASVHLISRSSASSSPSLSTSSACPLSTSQAADSSQKTGAILPANKTEDFEPYFGFNVGNSRTQLGALHFKSVDDWTNAINLLKSNFPEINAIRIYSTTDMNATMADGVWPHLEYALAALDNRDDMKILAGVWSNRPGVAERRFEKELKALDAAINEANCHKLFAVSVGNEDMYEIDRNGLDISTMADVLVSEMAQVRALLRGKGCYVPVTHTDTADFVGNTNDTSVRKILANVDQAIIVNMFPYWEGAQIANSRAYLVEAARKASNAAQMFGKEMWLGETGWPVSDVNWFENGAAAEPTVEQAQHYFENFGCSVLSGKGTAFYFVDWDENKIGSADSWGIFDHNGKSKLIDTSCRNFKLDMYEVGRMDMPKWLGGLA